MYAIPGLSLDPVAALKLFLGKLHPRCNALFQTPNQLHYEKAGTWYKNEPLGKNTLGQIMQNISKKADLSQVYTAHCLRASTVTSLHLAGVQPKQICSITKHRNEQSLAPYIHDSSSAQKRSCSDILSKPFVDKDAPTNRLFGEATSAFIDRTTERNAEVNVTLSSTSSDSHSIQAIMPNCSFHNCSINFNSKP